MTDRPSFVICVENGEYEASLEPLRIYRVLAPEPNDPPQWLRVVDESHEDYLYPRKWFIAVEVPEDARDLLSAVLDRD